MTGSWNDFNDAKQNANLSQMIWSVAEIIEQLSRLFELKAGDIIYTGTPAGVGPIESGDRLEVRIQGRAPLVNMVK